MKREGECSQKFDALPEKDRILQLRGPEGSCASCAHLWACSKDSHDAAGEAHQKALCVAI
jgi:hypothetical protein